MALPSLTRPGLLTLPGEQFGNSLFETLENHRVQTVLLDGIIHAYRIPVKFIRQAEINLLVREEGGVFRRCTLSLADVCVLFLDFDPLFVLSFAMCFFEGPKGGIFFGFLYQISSGLPEYGPD